MSKILKMGYKLLIQIILVRMFRQMQKNMRKIEWIYYVYNLSLLVELFFVIIELLD